MNDRVSLRNLRRPDIEALHGGSFPSVRGVAWDLKGQVVAIAGIAYYGTHVMAFSNITDAFRPHLNSMTTARGIKAVQALIDNCKAPVYAQADPNEPTASSLLQRIGFEETSQEGLFKWHS